MKHMRIDVTVDDEARDDTDPDVADVVTRYQVVQALQRLLSQFTDGLSAGTATDGRLQLRFAYGGPPLGARVAERRGACR